MQLGTSGMGLGISAEVPALLRSDIKVCLADKLAPLGLPIPGAGWNGLFWALHPGARAILGSGETALTLDAGKLAASRHVLS
jgi:predicted naringenin-chalcone synthase